MARKKKAPEPGASKAYLVSFGDTMTALLAFFIVLLSLADEQSGANLHAGTGSFVRAVDGFGVPGQFFGQRSANAVQQQHTSPQYLAEDPNDGEAAINPSGPDVDDNGMRVLDREADQFQRFIDEMQRNFDVKSLPQTKGEITFDFFNKLNKEPPYLPSNYQDVFSQVLPLLSQNQYRVEVIVWATTPGRNAWTRAIRQAEGVAAQIEDAAKLDWKQLSRLRSLGKPWLYSDVRRPIMSIVVRKVEAMIPNQG